MRALRWFQLALVGLLLAAAVSAAQGETLEDGELDTTAPPPDEAFLQDDGTGGGANETLDDRDMDATVPPPDDAYLDEPVPGAEGSAGPASKPVPAPAALLGLLTFAAVAPLVRRG